MNENPTILIIAGEVSGDMHGAELVKAIKKIRPGAHFFGIGGKEMRDAGVETLFSTEEMAVMGITEVLAKYSFFKQVFKSILEQARIRQPDAAILVDYPGFNLRIADELHAMNIKNIYYICPQVWAWRQSRIKRMARIIDQLITIFPFEKKYFDGTGLPVDFAGHPLVHRLPSREKASETELPWKQGPRVALLPGSRIHEIQRIFPSMWKAAEILESEHPSASFIVAAPSKEMADEIRNKIAVLGGGPARCSVVYEKTSDILGQADTTLVASGTATVEAALMLCPMVIAYRTAALTYFLGKLLVKVSHIGMVNIIAGRGICPEYIQGQVTPSALAAAASPLLSDTQERRDMIKALEEVKDSLGSQDASTKAAESVIQTLDR
ncbi:lipid-A-disaccharide synthase [bacterium E08(2017)]|nr:lipid-A-disaccharide synthase [bacterium E08(2017)]